MGKLPGILAALFLLSGSCFADINIYLYPRITYTADVLLSQIGKLDGDPNTIAQIKDLSIDENLFSDGYLDRKKLLNMLKENVTGTINIYGSGVRITRLNVDPAMPDRQVSVKKGDTVRFLVINARIRVESRGIALKDGSAGDVIPVKLKGSRVANGKILNERTVELEL